MCCQSLSCVQLCDPMDCSLLDLSVRGISQARILEWVAISFSRDSSMTRDWTCVSCISRWILYHWATREALPLCSRLLSCRLSQGLRKPPMMPVDKDIIKGPTPNFRACSPFCACNTVSVPLESISLLTLCKHCWVGEDGWEELSGLTCSQIALYVKQYRQQPCPSLCPVSHRFGSFLELDWMERIPAFLVCNFSNASLLLVF